MSGDLELRYRRALRLLPRYYREQWEEDMVAAFLDGWLTGDPDEDSVTMEYDRPGWAEIASVAGLAARLYLGAVGAPRRYLAWGQAVRGTVLALLLTHAIWSSDWSSDVCSSDLPSLARTTRAVAERRSASSASARRPSAVSR